MILRDMSDRAGIYMRLYIFLHTSITNWLNPKNFTHPLRFARRQLICPLNLECAMVGYSLRAFAKVGS